jgi:hypothetical protein
VRRLKLPRVEESLGTDGRISRAWFDALRDAEIEEQDVTTTATAGLGTLPAGPVGFLKVKINGTICKIPYYAV